MYNKKSHSPLAMLSNNILCFLETLIKEQLALPPAKRATAFQTRELYEEYTRFCNRMAVPHLCTPRGRLLDSSKPVTIKGVCSYEAFKLPPGAGSVKQSSMDFLKIFQDHGLTLTKSKKHGNFFTFDYVRLNEFIESQYSYPFTTPSILAILPKLKKGGELTEDDLRPLPLPCKVTLRNMLNNFVSDGSGKMVKILSAALYFEHDDFCTLLRESLPESWEEHKASKLPFSVKGHFLLMNENRFRTATLRIHRFENDNGDEKEMGSAIRMATRPDLCPLLRSFFLQNTDVFVHQAEPQTPYLGLPVKMPVAAFVEACVFAEKFGFGGESCSVEKFHDIMKEDVMRNLPGIYLSSAQLNLLHDELFSAAVADTSGVGEASYLVDTDEMKQIYGPRGIIKKERFKESLGMQTGLGFGNVEVAAFLIFLKKLRVEGSFPRWRRKRPL